MTVTPQSGRALVIKAKGGLGNRILSAVTGLLLAELNGRTPVIDWRDGMYVDPGTNLYPLLFGASWMGEAKSFDAEAEVAPPIWSGQMNRHPTDLISADFPRRHSDPFIYRKLSVDLNGPDPEEPVAVFWSYLPKLVRLRRKLARDSRFSERPLAELTGAMLDRYFAPVPEVGAAVEELFRDRARPVIGVHIRYTDRKVPLPRILARLERLLRQHPEADIFLATDSAEAQQKVLTRFPKAFTLEKTLAPDGAALHVAAAEFADPVTEARSALADMVALSRCDWLIHSSHSTFSVCAAAMGRIPRERQADIDRYNPRIALKRFIQARS